MDSATSMLAPVNFLMTTLAREHPMNDLVVCLCKRIRTLIQIINLIVLVLLIT
jgi:hypothetical protein